MVIRPARPHDAAALGRVMVESWLDSHRDQIPQPAWDKRVAEWTPDVSARGWGRVLSQQAAEDVPRDLLLLAEDELGAPVALAYFTPADDRPDDVAELSSLYVLPEHRGQGIGSALLRSGGHNLVQRGVTSLRVVVLTANLPALAFYASRGASEAGTGTVDEEGFVLATTLLEWSDVAAVLDG